MPDVFDKRLSIPIEQEDRDRLNDVIPAGVRAAFARAMLMIGIESVERSPELLKLLLNGPALVRLAPTNGQNLTTSKRKK